MDSQRKFPQMSVVLSVALLCSQSVAGQTTRRSARAVRPDDTTYKQAGARQKQRPTVSKLEAQDRLEPQEQERVRPAGQNKVEQEEQNKIGREEADGRLDDPAGALKFRHLQMQDEKGDIPLDGMEKARQHVRRMKAEQQKRIKARQQSAQGVNDSQVGILAAGIEPDSWQPLGPGNVGGRIRSIVIHPTNTNNMWVGSVTGGIWRTTNGGVSWQPVNDFLANLAVSTMVISPTNSNTMYAGTGEGLWPVLSQNSYIDAVQGAGIYQSLDGGVTWNQLASTNPAAAAPVGCGGIGAVPCPAFWLFVNRLAISPNGNTILAATNGGVARSTDGGATWTQRTANRTADIEFRPGDSNRAMIGELGAARFTLDGGQTWTAATFNPAVTSGGRIELATSPGNASIVYAAVNQNNGEIYRSQDGGQTYTRVNTGNSIFNAGAGNQGTYDNALWLNPQNPDTVIVGGIFLWRGTTTFSGGVGTLSLTQISDGSSNSDGTPRSAHADNHVIVSHPGFNNSTNRIVYFGNDGGIYRANDAITVAQTSGWTELNNNLSITQFFGAAGNAATGVIVGGTQDNGTQRFAGDAEGWTRMNGSDGGYCAADPTDGNYFYGETQYLGVVRSTNGGQLNSGSSISAGLADAGNQSVNFAAPIVLDPIDPNTLLAGGFSLWRSQDAKATTPTWRVIKNPTAGNSPISAIAVAPNTSSLILVGHNNGDIYRTFGGTLADPRGTWSRIDTAALPKRFVTRLVVDNTPHATNTNWYYATFGGFNADNVWRSTDNGQTWTNITGTGATALPAVPVRSLTYHPTNSNLLYVGTEIGIFTSEDAGATWEPTQDGPANVSVDELFWLGGDLVAATHGRGLYQASGGAYVKCDVPVTGDGTFGRPFKTVQEAINATLRYRPIWIFAGTCTEPFATPINKRLELRSLGGPATIRKP